MKKLACQIAYAGVPETLRAKKYSQQGTDGSDPNAQAFLVDAVRHCKAVGFSGISSLSKKVALQQGPGIVDISKQGALKQFIDASRTGRFWEREAE